MNKSGSPLSWLLFLLLLAAGISACSPPLFGCSITPSPPQWLNESLLLNHPPINYSNSQITTHTNIYQWKPRFIRWQLQRIACFFPGESVLPTRQTCRPPSLISAGWERLLLLAGVDSFITLDLFNTAQHWQETAGNQFMSCWCWWGPGETQIPKQGHPPTLHQTTVLYISRKFCVWKIKHWMSISALVYSIYSVVRNIYTVRKWKTL